VNCQLKAIWWRIPAWICYKESDENSRSSYWIVCSWNWYLEPKLGKGICSITLYEKVTRAIILLNSEDYPILMVSFDKTNKRIDHESLILHGILRGYFPIILLGRVI
jgi:hypothetical protein